jgi:phosphoesterase RecJ-like protein
MNLEELKNLLSTPTDIVVTSHTNPDGDAIGSALGMTHFLRKLGHRVTAIVPNAMPDFLEWLPGANHVLYHDEQYGVCSHEFYKAKIIFCLDYNGLDRIDDMKKALEYSKATFVMIDHHLYPEDFAHYTFSDTSYSSTCEMVYDWVGMLGQKELLSQEALTCLYTGILTDTGGFSFSLSPRLMRIVAEFLEKGIDHPALHDILFNSYTEKRLRLLAFCLHERLEILPGGKAGIIALSNEDHVNYNILKGDTEGIVNYVLKIKNIQATALVSERKNEIKLSLRSKGKYSVQAICSKYFNGGGHFNASGGKSNKPLEETLEVLRKAFLSDE